jgi:hypothetical protein
MRTSPVIVSIARETALKLGIGFSEKKLKNKLTGSVNLVGFRVTATRIDSMPDKHSPDKEPLSLQIPRTLRGRLIRAARKAGKTYPQYVTEQLTNATNDVTLSSADYQAIAEATAQAERTGKRLATKFPD